LTDSQYFSITLWVYSDFSQNGMKLSGKKGNRKRIDGGSRERLIPTIHKYDNVFIHSGLSAE
jgi:hypothetical protein